MNKILIISECYIRLVNMGKLITWRKEKNMKVEEALKYEPVLKVKEGENLKKVDVAEFDKIKVYIMEVLQNFSMEVVETFI